MTGSTRSLAGRRIVLTAQRRADEFAGALERRGAEVVHAPTMSHVPHLDDAELIAETRQLIAIPPDVLVVTTGIGFTGWLEAAEALGVGPALREALAHTRILTRGPKARGAVIGQALAVEWTADSEQAQEIRNRLAEERLRGVRVAVQHHGAGADGIDEQLIAQGADVVSLVVYRWGPSPNPAAVREAIAQVADGMVDCVAFTAAPGARAFLDAAREYGRLDEVLDRLRTTTLAAAVGDTTAQPLRDNGVEPLVPERARLGALVRAISEALSPPHLSEEA